VGVAGSLAVGWGPFLRLRFEKQSGLGAALFSGLEKGAFHKAEITWAGVDFA
jgi:hypothetical protein